MTMYRVTITVPYLNRIGVGSLTCPWCAAPKPACEIHTHVGSWRCTVCNRHGMVIRSRGTVGVAPGLTLELAAHCLDNPQPPLAA